MGISFLREMKIKTIALLSNKRSTLLILGLLVLGVVFVVWLITRTDSNTESLNESIELVEGGPVTIAHPITDVVAAHKSKELSTDEAISQLEAIYQQSADEEKIPAVRAKITVCVEAKDTECLETALGSMPNDQDLTLHGEFHLAQLYEQLNQDQLALSWYNKALKTAEQQGDEAVEAVQLIKLSIQRLGQ